MSLSEILWIIGSSPIMTKRMLDSSFSLNPTSQKCNSRPVSEYGFTLNGFTVNGVTVAPTVNSGGNPEIQNIIGTFIAATGYY
jgi:hypothetical protein